MSKKGPTLRFSKSEMVGVVTTGDGFASPVAHHPNPLMVDSRGRRTLALNGAQADMVTELVALPGDADPRRLYGTWVVAEGEEGRPFVRIVWFANGGDDSTYVDAVSELESKWERATRVVPERRGGTGPFARGGDTQPASGVYTELGTGVMPGRGRDSVSIQGEACFLPYSRNAALSDELEDALARVCAEAADRACECLPEDVSELLRPHAGPAPLVSAYQYPHSISGRSMPSSHQVVLRRPAEEDDADAEENERACRLAVSDLHTDSVDGEMGCLGSMAQYICRLRPGVLCHTTGSALAYRDLVVFPTREGGRGVRVRVAQPGWTCLVFMRTRECLHGGVTPGPDCPPVTLSLGGDMRLMRIVTYPMVAVERLLERAAKDTGGDVVGRLRARSDHRMQRRIGAALG